MIKKHSHLNKQIVASYSMKVVLVVTLILAIWKREWIWVLGCVFGIFIGFVPTLLKQNVEITLPWSVELFIASVCALNMGGVLLNAYYTIPGYGGLTQFLTSFLVAFLVFAVIYILDQYWDGLKMDKYAMAFVVVVTTMAACAILEFIKWFRIFGKQSFTVEDVLMSLLVGTIGGIVMALIGVNLIKKGRFEEMTKDLGKQLEGLGKQLESTVTRRKKKE